MHSYMAIKDVITYKYFVQDTSTKRTTLNASVIEAMDHERTVALFLN